MKKASLNDFLLLTLLGALWGSAFFNIKIATISYPPISLSLGRVFLATLPLVAYCLYKNIKIEAFGAEWKLFICIAVTNFVLPFFFISLGIIHVQSNLAAILMSVAPISATILGHFFVKSEPFNLLKSTGVLIGFAGILFIFNEKSLITDSNIAYALVIILAPVCYTLGGLLTLRLKNKGNVNVTSSILVWAIIILLPLCFIFEAPLDINPKLAPTLSLIYLGIFSTAAAWLLRFYILQRSGLVFQSLVAYLTPIFGLLFSTLILDEIITYKVYIAVIFILTGIYLVKKAK